MIEVTRYVTDPWRTKKRIPMREQVVKTNVASPTTKRDRRREVATSDIDRTKGSRAWSALKNGEGGWTFGA